MKFEVAEFDSLRDEGTAYARALEAAGCEVTLREVSGAMHGYDIVEKAPTTRASVEARIAYLQTKLYKNEEK